MRNIEFNSFLLSKIISPLPGPLVSSFERLQPDSIEYRNTTFQSRYRCFSSYRIDGENVIRDDSLRPLFNGQRKFHTTYQNTVPSPDKELIASGANEELLAHLLPAFPLRNPENYAFGINQVRVIADDIHLGSPAPGLHQDGYAYSCHCNISRENVSGGASLLSKTSNPTDIFIEHILQPNEFVFFDDRKLFHTATPITQRLIGEPTWRDMIIIDVMEKA